MILDDCYISFVNLLHRTDRLEHMNQQIEKAGLSAERFEAIKWRDVPMDGGWKIMLNRSPGAIGCWVSQCAVMERALYEDKHAMVMEDDIVLCSDFKERMEYVSRFLEGKEWDIVFLGGTVHINPPWWHIGGRNPDLPNTKLTTDAECTDDPRIMRVYGAFSTHHYIVNKESITKVLYLLETVRHEAMGIDWAFIRLGDQLTSYMMLPGMTKQIDNQSDIGSGITVFSGFAKLGPYWWQDRMEDFDPSTFDFGEAKK